MVTEGGGVPPEEKIEDKKEWVKGRIDHDDKVRFNALKLQGVHKKDSDIAFILFLANIGANIYEKQILALELGGKKTDGEPISRIREA